MRLNITITGDAEARLEGLGAAYGTKPTTAARIIILGSLGCLNVDDKGVPSGLAVCAHLNTLLKALKGNPEAIASVRELLGLTRTPSPSSVRTGEEDGMGGARAEQRGAQASALPVLSVEAGTVQYPSAPGTDDASDSPTSAGPLAAGGDVLGEGTQSAPNLCPTDHPWSFTQHWEDALAAMAVSNGEKWARCWATAEVARRYQTALFHAERHPTHNRPWKLEDVPEPYKHMIEDCAEELGAGRFIAPSKYADAVASCSSGGGPEEDDA